MPWYNFGSGKRYIANSGEELVNCLVEKHGTGDKGIIERDSAGKFSKYVNVSKSEGCIKGSVVREQTYFTQLPKGHMCEFQGENLDITLILGSDKKVLDCYSIPDGHSIIVGMNDYDVVKTEEIETDKYKLKGSQNLIECAGLSGEDRCKEHQERERTNGPQQPKI